MNGTGVGRTPSSSDYDSRYSSGLNAQPSSKVLLEGYNDPLSGTDSSRAGQARQDQVYVE